jgi:AraC-like DNA-binding protein
MVFDAPYNGLLVLRDTARRRLLRANPAARDAIEQQLKAQIDGEGHTRSFTDRVRTLITDAIPGGDFGQDALARKLGLGRTTLKRRLAAEGTGVREVVDEVRKKIALRALLQPELSVIEVAFRSGYEDATAFNKAFKRWTGKSPAKYRSELRTRTVERE